MRIYFLVTIQSKFSPKKSCILHPHREEHVAVLSFLQNTEWSREKRHQEPKQMTAFVGHINTKRGSIYFHIMPCEYQLAPFPTVQICQFLKWCQDSNAMPTYLGVSPIKHNGIYFRINRQKLRLHLVWRYSTSLVIWVEAKLKGRGLLFVMYTHPTRVPGKEGFFGERVCMNSKTCWTRGVSGTKENA